MSSEEVNLIAHHISDVATSNPRHRNEPVLKRTGTPVWVVIGYCLRACHGSVAEAAQDYQLTEDEVEATLAYYRQHPELDICRDEGGDSGAEPLSGRMHLGPSHGSASGA